MVDACRKRGVILMEAFMWRHQPRTLSIRQMLRQGTIGELRADPARRFRSRSRPTTGGSIHREAVGLSGTSAATGVNAARLFTGEEPSRFRALARKGPSGVDLSLTASSGIPQWSAGAGRLQLRTAVPVPPTSFPALAG